jgi:asparagine synthase (glutamine-hydrolysing)
MCGIAGYRDFQAILSADERARVARAMTDSIVYRGPDHGAAWMDDACGAALGYRRLAILDLSPAGEQPFHSQDGRYVMVFNGEVYNYRTFRDELTQRGYRFRGHSDSEAMLAAVQEWGVRAAVERFNGMYALAIWDRQERQLHLVRDRVGIKPLYYGWSQGVFLFASELKAFAAHPAFEARIDQAALGDYLRYGYVPCPRSIFRDVYKLPPGAILTLPDEGDSRPAPVHYWTPQPAFQSGDANPFAGTDDEAIATLDELLRDAVKLQMISDVPLGAFLSGGIDSSTVVALMQAQSDRAVKTFSIGFPDAGFDEAGYARQVAKHLGTDHTELYVSPQDSMAIIPQLPTMYDEPFADSSQIPTYLVSRLARTAVTVSLSGDGGDELFAGYERYVWADRMVNSTGRLPAFVRRGASAAIGALSAEQWDALGGALRYPRLGDKAYKLRRAFAHASPEQIYRNMHMLWEVPPLLHRAAALAEAGSFGTSAAYLRVMQQFDLAQYLPDDILTKVDRASMAVSLEARVPLLDHRVVEFAARLPRSLVIRDGIQKWLLRQVLYRYVPSSLFERPKSGFALPIANWLRGDLREWAEALFDGRRLREQGLDPQPIYAAWQAHLSGRSNQQHSLWAVLMYTAWSERWLSKA